MLCDGDLDTQTDEQKSLNPCFNGICSAMAAAPWIAREAAQS